MKKIIVILLIFSTVLLSSQERVPEPYEVDEFNPILHDIRRSTIIFSGAFPLGYMYSSMITDGFFSESEFYMDRTEQEQIEFKLLTALSFAGFVTLIDFIIEKFFRGRG